MNRFFRIVASLACTFGVLSTVYAVCPVYTHKEDVIIGSQTSLPDGWFVYVKEKTSGIFKSSLKTFKQDTIPNTIGDTCSYIDISDDGKWLVYLKKNPKSVVAIRVDGTGKTILNISQINSNGHTNVPDVIGFLRSSPKGAELLYPIMNYSLYATQVTLPTTGLATVGASRKVYSADAAKLKIIEFWGQYGAWKDQITGCFHHIVNGNEIAMADYLTIPDGGNGIANDADFAQWENLGPNLLDNDNAYWGCGFTMSHDGQYCLQNSGWIGDTCVPSHLVKSKGFDQDHKGFYITRFKKSSDAPIPLNDIINKPEYGVSINWVPLQYRIGDQPQVDFNEWYFSNSNKFVIGTQKGSLTPVKAIWVVQWETNTWTMVTPNQKADEYSSPAIFITDNSIIPVKNPMVQKSTSFSMNSKMVLSNSSQVKLDKGISGFRIFSFNGKQIWEFSRVASNNSVTISLPSNVVRNGSLIVEFVK